MTNGQDLAGQVAELQAAPVESVLAVRLSVKHSSGLPMARRKRIWHIPMLSIRRPIGRTLVTAGSPFAGASVAVPYRPNRHVGSAGRFVT